MEPNDTWQRCSPTRTPVAMAEWFAEDLFPGRHINGFEGEWKGTEFAGSFRLVGGAHTYRITCDRWGRYCVSIK